MSTLEEYYESLGYPRSHWHIGWEHPHLEEYAIRLLQGMPRARVLEVGYQAGGFAVPVILAMRERPDFVYLGIDSMAYDTAVDGKVIVQYLENQGVTGCYEFAVGDAGKFLAKMPREQFDLVLMDHDKSFYPRELRTLVRRELVSPDGCILFHDVLRKAREVWEDCVLISRAYGYSCSVVSEVPEGLAVVKRDRLTERVTLRQRFERLAVDAKICVQGARGLIRRLRWAFRGKSLHRARGQLLVRGIAG